MLQKRDLAYQLSLQTYFAQKQKIYIITIGLYINNWL